MAGQRNEQTDKILDEGATEAYNERMNYAKEADQAQTDDQIKALLIKHEENEQPTAEDIKEFREKEQPALKEFSNGKPGKAEFEKNFKKFRDTWTYKFILLKESVGLFTLLWLFLGVSSAFKIAASSSGATSS